MSCIAVIGSASNSPVDKRKLLAASVLGSALRSNCAHVLTCGMRFGLIGAVLDSMRGSLSVREAVIVQGSGEEENLHPEAGTLTIVQTVAARKEFLLNRAQVVMALPGGLGTHDEIFTFLAQLKYTSGHKIILINIDGFFDPLLSIASNMIQEGFLKQKQLGSLHVFQDVESAVSAVIDSIL